MNDSVRRRFWSKVDKSGMCWEWTGYRDGRRYGRFNVSGAQHSAHRISWLLTHGPIPDGMCICHHCDNPPCVRPDHLFIGDVALNNRDMVEKGRARNPPAERRKEQTHCKHGHEFTLENTYVRRDFGTRQCRACHNARSVARRARRLSIIAFGA